MEPSMLSHYGVAYAKLATFLAIFRWFRREPRLPLNVETVIAAAYHRIDEQDVQLKAASVENGKQAVEIRLMRYDLERLKMIIKEAKCVRCRKNAGIVLSDYDYVRLRQTTMKDE